MKILLFTISKPYKWSNTPSEKKNISMEQGLTFEEGYPKPTLHVHHKEYQQHRQTKQTNRVKMIVALNIY